MLLLINHGSLILFVLFNKSAVLLLLNGCIQSQPEKVSISFPLDFLGAKYQNETFLLPVSQGLLQTASRHKRSLEQWFPAKTRESSFSLGGEQAAAPPGEDRPLQNPHLSRWLSRFQKAAPPFLAVLVKMPARYLCVCSQTDASYGGLGERQWSISDWQGCWTRGLCGVFNEKATVFLLHLFDFRVSFINTIRPAGLTASGLSLLPAVLWVSSLPTFLPPSPSRRVHSRLSWASKRSKACTFPPWQPSGSWVCPMAPSPQRPAPSTVFLQASISSCLATCTSL